MEAAGRAALFAGSGKSPRDYAPAAGSRRSLQRRNPILALMAREGYIPERFARGLIQGSVVVLANSDVAVLAEAGGAAASRSRARHGQYGRPE